MTIAPHGRLIADATKPAWNGYLLTVACSSGVVFGGGSRRGRGPGPNDDGVAGTRPYHIAYRSRHVSH